VGMRIYVCIYVCMYICMCVVMYVFMYVYINILVYLLRLNTNVFMFIFIRTDNSARSLENFVPKSTKSKRNEEL